MREVVLVGGGHSHLVLLRRFGMEPPEGCRLTLVTRETESVYSAMLPGIIAGHFAPDEGRIDLRPLARFAGARLLHAEAVGLDPEGRRLHLRDRPSIPYDLLSLDVGSGSGVDRVPGAAGRVVPVKPLDGFLGRWRALERTLDGRTDPVRIAAVGGGAGGVEILLAVERRLRERGVPASYVLVTASEEVLPDRTPGARRRLRRILEGRGVEIRAGEEVVAVDRRTLRTDSGGVVEADEILWVTSSVAPSWPGESGLETDPEGFVLVDDTLRSVSHPSVFAAGDVATMRNHPRPKAGVIAVRQGRPLARNLRRAVEGREPRPFRPQRTFLTILATADRRAVASRGPFVVEGGWVWRVKEWIDRRWVRRFRDLPAMDGEEVGDAGAGRDGADPGGARRGGDRPDGARRGPAAAMRCAGCGGKVGGAVLARALEGLPRTVRPEVLGGLDAPDDGALVTVPAGKVQVQSVDFFRDPLGDPLLLGRLAAVHALGDLHAMGADSVTALALVTLPHGAPASQEADLRQVLRGAAEVLAEEGAVLVGGHTGEGEALAAGFAVTGTADPDAVTGKAGLRPGDVLVLGKPLGTGVLLAAEMRGRARSSWIEAAVDSMLRSNRDAGRILRAHGAEGVTDVTGFGFAGHLLEMLRASGCDARVDPRRLPLLPGAAEIAGEGIRSTLHPGNVEVAAEIEWEEGSENVARFALYDPQTSGGLLAGVPAGRADACLKELRTAGYPAAVVGVVTASSERPRLVIGPGDGPDRRREGRENVTGAPASREA